MSQKIIIFAPANFILRMKKFLQHTPLLLTSAVLLCGLTCGCFDDNQSETIYTDEHNALITSVTLGNNSNVCSGLSNYTFTVDNLGQSDPELLERCHDLWDQNEKYSDGTNKYQNLTPGIVFNADSLPIGTIADSITVTINHSTLSALHVYQYDEELNLLNHTNFKDTQVVWFDDYAVTRLELTAQDGYTRKNYFMKVNVAKVSGDTIKWHYLAKGLYDMAEVTDQTVDTLGETLYWFTTLSDGSNQVRTAPLMSNLTSWSEAETVSAPSTLNLSTLLAWRNQFYAVGDGALLTSTDGKTWTVASSAQTFVSLLGIQLATQKDSEHLSAIIDQEGAKHFSRSEDGKTWTLDEMMTDGVRSSVVPAEFPIKDFSRPISVAANQKGGNSSSRIYISGGTLADGSLTSSTWSCDGRQWAEFPQIYLAPQKRGTIVRYTLDSDYPDSFWIMQTGEMANGAVSDTLYFSENRGVSWKRLSLEYLRYGDTAPLAPFGCSSAILQPKTYSIYFIGGKDKEGNQQSNIVTGQLPKLAMKKKR